MTEEEVLNVLNGVGAVMQGHFVYTSGLHGDYYVNKDAIYPFTKIVAKLCWAISELFANENVQVVVGPAIGGVILSHKIATQLVALQSNEVLSLYAEYETTGDKKVLVLKRGYDKLVSGKRVLVVEDILNTGGSALGAVNAVTKCGGNVIGVAALCNRGGVTAEMLSVPILKALVNFKLMTWAEYRCPLCEQGVPVNTNVGKGNEFLARKNAT